MERDTLILKRVGNTRKNRENMAYIGVSECKEPCYKNLKAQFKNQ